MTQRQAGFRERDQIMAIPDVEPIQIKSSDGRVSERL